MSVELNWKELVITLKNGVQQSMFVTAADFEAVKIDGGNITYFGIIKTPLVCKRYLSVRYTEVASIQVTEAPLFIYDSALVLDEEKGDKK
jgi:hypothetical protein